MTKVKGDDPRQVHPASSECCLAQTLSNREALGLSNRIDCLTPYLAPLPAGSCTGDPRSKDRLSDAEFAQLQQRKRDFAAYVLKQFQPQTDPESGGPCAGSG